jgi:predicted secreted hydrolase
VRRAGALLLALLLAFSSAAQAPTFAPVVPGAALAFPRDYGSHPDFRIEWWYVTGWLSGTDGEPLGFQITFFRTRPAIDVRNPSSFAPRQILIAHVALSDPKYGRLLMDQRIRRIAPDVGGAAEQDTDLTLEGWSLKRLSDRYSAQLKTEDFGFDLDLRPTQDPIRNGLGGFSRKGPSAKSASYYYSVPHLVVTGRLARAGRSEPVTGEAWLDHEWSSDYLDPQAQGWDWLGLNLRDGGALMAFRMRDQQGATRWAGGSFRRADGSIEILTPEQVDFRPQRTWHSPRTDITYPVEWQVHAGELEVLLKPLMDDQENDTRLSTGAIYWEGAVRADAKGLPVGRGYLELTGYGAPLQLR